MGVFSVDVGLPVCYYEVDIVALWLLLFLLFLDGCKGVARVFCAVACVVVWLLGRSSWLPGCLGNLGVSVLMCSWWLVMSPQHAALL